MTTITREVRILFDKCAKCGRDIIGDNTGDGRPWQHVDGEPHDDSHFPAFGFLAGDRVRIEKPASLLPGIGPRTSERLRTAGIETVTELARAPDGVLEGAFGPRHGPALRELGNGVGSTALTTERARKSESRETTFPHDVTDRGRMLETVDALAESVCRSLAGHGVTGRTVTLKIRLTPWRTHTRSRTLPSATCDPATVVGVARELLERFNPQAPVRLLGVGVAGLVADEGHAPLNVGTDGRPENGEGPERDAPLAEGAPSGPGSQERLAL